MQAITSEDFILFKLSSFAMEHNHYNTQFDCQQALDEREVALDEHEWRIVEVFHRGLNNFHTSIVSNHRLVKRPH